MKPGGKLNRRSFLATVAGASFVGAAGVVTGSASAETVEQCSDSDTGSNSDPGGRGRNCGTRNRVRQPSNCSDSDTGRYGDPGGNGRRCSSPQESCSDSDTGRYSDPSGRGRRCGAANGRPYTGVTDSDQGANRDVAGYGRGRRRRSCTDSDTGSNRDPAGRGRRCS